MPRAKYNLLPTDGKINIQLGFNKMIENVNKAYAAKNGGEALYSGVSPVTNLQTDPRVQAMWTQVKMISSAKDKNQDLGELMKMTNSSEKDKILGAIQAYEAAYLALQEDAAQQAIIAHEKAELEKENLKEEFSGVMLHFDNEDQKPNDDEEEKINEINDWFAKLEKLDIREKELNKQLDELDKQEFGVDKDGRTISHKEVLKEAKEALQQASCQLLDLSLAESNLRADLAKTQKKLTQKEASLIERLENQKEACRFSIEKSESIIKSIESNPMRQLVLQGLKEVHQEKDQLLSKRDYMAQKIQSLSQRTPQMQNYLQQQQQQQQEETLKSSAPTMKRTR